MCPSPGRPSSQPAGPWYVDPRWLVASIGASIAGLLVHNLAEFPPAILLAPETLVPTAITIFLGIGLSRRPGRGVYLATAVWAAIVLVVGGGSVLPLGVWPFVPEQTAGHYAAHLVYAVCQVPLLWLAVSGFRARRRDTGQ